MPYRRYSGVKRKVSVRIAKRYDSRRKVTRKQVSRIAKRVIRSTGEKKYSDKVLSSATVIDWNGTVIGLSDIMQSAGASTDTTRVGDSITPTSLQFNCLVKCGKNQTALTDSVNAFRMVIIRWKPAFGSVAPTPITLLQSIGLYYSAHGPFVHDQRPQFDVLFDRKILLDYVNKPYQVINGYLRLKRKINYIAGSQTNQQGGLYCLWISDADSAGITATKPVVADFSFRVNFMDS